MRPEPRREPLRQKISPQHGPAADGVACLQEHDHDDGVHDDFRHAVDGRIEEAAPDDVGEDEERQNEGPHRGEDQ